MKKTRAKWLWIVLIGLVALMTACSGGEEQNMDQRTMVIKANTQAEYEDLRLGIGYLGEDPAKNEMMAQLWPFLRNEEKGRPPIEAYEGDVVVIGPYQLEILTIRSESVKIAFSTLAE